MTSSTTQASNTQRAKAKPRKVATAQTTPQATQAAPVSTPVEPMPDMQSIVHAVNALVEQNRQLIQLATEQMAHTSKQTVEVGKPRKRNVFLKEDIHVTATKTLDEEYAELVKGVGGEDHAAKLGDMYELHVNTVWHDLFRHTHHWGSIPVVVVKDDATEPTARFVKVN